MENVLIVYAAPEPKSLNGALLAAALKTLTDQGRCVEVSDLYGMKFKAVLDAADFPDRWNTSVFDPAAEQMHAIATDSIAPDIAAEIEKVRRADLLIIQFPIWWTSMPAILKGWFDRVFAQGFVVNVGTGEVYGRGLLRGKKALVVVTAGSPAELYAPGGPHGDLHELLRPLTHNLLEFCGLEVLPTHVVYNAAGIAPDDADREVELYQDRLLAIEA
ncbi:MAG: NAD(P)H-dependent oxidoreductase [Methanospirillum sp.]